MNLRHNFFARTSLKYNLYEILGKTKVDIFSIALIEYLDHHTNKGIDQVIGCSYKNWLACLIERIYLLIKWHQAIHSLWKISIFQLMDMPCNIFIEFILNRVPEKSIVHVVISENSKIFIFILILQESLTWYVWINICNSWLGIVSLFLLMSNSDLRRRRLFLDHHLFDGFALNLRLRNPRPWSLLCRLTSGNSISSSCCRSSRWLHAKHWFSHLVLLAVCLLLITITWGKLAILSSRRFQGWSWSRRSKANRKSFNLLESGFK